MSGDPASHLVSEEVIRLELDGHPGAITHQLGGLQPAELPTWGEGGMEDSGGEGWLLPMENMVSPVKSTIM